MKCTGPLDVIPNGKLLMDEEGNGKIFSIKEKRRNMDWTLYFHDKSNVWFLGMMRIDQMIDMLEKDGNLNEHPSAYSHEKGLPLSKGKWTMTSFNMCSYGRPDIEIGWQEGEDVHNVEQMGVISTNPL
jgi:hypothetical protein